MSNWNFFKLGFFWDKTEIHLDFDETNSFCVSNMMEFELTNLQLIELASAFLGIVSVWLNAKHHIMGWPIGIVAVILAAWVYFHSRLFAETGLQVFYMASGFYGWWQWSKTKTSSQNQDISSLDKKTLILSLIFGAILSIGLGFFFKTFTTADFPWVDSGLTALSLVAQIWLARKYIENWWLWGAINVVSVGLYAVKGLYFFLGYFVVLLVLSFVGYRNWKARINLVN